MFLFRRTGVLVEKLVHPPSTSSHKGSNDVAQVSVLDDTSTGSSSTTSVASALERCVICEQTYTSFPKASQREHSIPPQGICIACVEQSLGIADTDEYHTQQSPSSDFQASFLRIDTDGSDHLFCLGCHQRLPLSNFPEGFIVESCRHEPGVCLDCIEKSIIESLDNELPQVISCPQCGDTMSEGDVWRFSGNQTFQR